LHRDGADLEDMLTPAEELGLGGMNLALRVRRALYRTPEEQLIEVLRRVHEESARRHLVYLRDGEVDTINVLACPVAVLPDQIAYVHGVSLTIHRALKRLPEIYMSDLEVRDILKIPPAEEEWLWKCWGKSHQETDPVFGRLDALVDFTSPTWKDSLRFVEPNLSGVGGLYLVPTCERIIAEVVLSLLHAADPELHLETGADMRDLLMQEVLDHLQAIGRPAQTICFVEPMGDATGTDEQEALARYLHDRYGLKALHADPRSLAMCRGEVTCGDAVIDLAYRDYSVTDLLRLAEEGADVEPMRTLFAENRMVSSITAELDQKSCWEVLTDRGLTRKYFSADERQVFRRHILWTRLVADRKTDFPDGRSGGLLEYMRREHDRLVLKPNRAYGGQDVLIGHALSASQWDAAIERALKDSERWVVQQLAGIPVYDYPVLGPDGRIHAEPFHTVMGFAATKDGLAILGRASQKQVVNVAQRGGMCAVVIGRPPGGLLGPGRR
jgi:hypothetical protein